MIFIERRCTNTVAARIHHNGRRGAVHACTQASYRRRTRPFRGARLSDETQLAITEHISCANFVVISDTNEHVTAILRGRGGVCMLPTKDHRPGFLRAHRQPLVGSVCLVSASRYMFENSWCMRWAIRAALYSCRHRLLWNKIYAMLLSPAPATHSHWSLAAAARCRRQSEAFCLLLLQ